METLKLKRTKTRYLRLKQWICSYTAGESYKEFAYVETGLQGEQL